MIQIKYSMIWGHIKTEQIKSEYKSLWGAEELLYVEEILSDTAEEGTARVLVDGGLLINSSWLLQYVLGIKENFTTHLGLLTSGQCYTRLNILNVYEWICLVCILYCLGLHIISKIYFNAVWISDYNKCIIRGFRNMMILISSKWGVVCPCKLAKRGCTGRLPGQCYVVTRVLCVFVRAFLYQCMIIYNYKMLHILNPQ